LGKMIGMAELSKYHRLSAFSHPSIIKMRDEAVSRNANERDVRFRGRKLSDQAFVNAAVMALCDMSPEEQVRVLNVQLGRLAAILEGREPAAVPEPRVPTMQAAETVRPEEEGPPTRKRRASR
jgi:hypothetical protein